MGAKLKRMALAGALLLGACKGAGCTPGDFIDTCSKACSGHVQIALPVQEVCVCEVVK